MNASIALTNQLKLCVSVKREYFEGNQLEKVTTISCCVNDDIIY